MMIDETIVKCGIVFEFHVMNHVLILNMHQHCY